VGLCFPTRSPVTFLKSINGARHVLGIQHGNQLGQRLFSIPRSTIAETLIFIGMVMALIAATVMWGCPAEVVDTVEKAAVITPRCTRTYRGVDRAGGDYASRGRVARRRPRPEGALGYLLRRLRLRAITSRAAIQLMFDFNFSRRYRPTVRGAGPPRPSCRPH
jgi:hypothetical protein